MFVCECMYCGAVCTSAWRICCQGSAQALFLSGSLSGFLRQSPSLSLEFTDSARPDGHWAPGSTCLYLFLWDRDWRTTLLHSFLTWALLTRTPVPSFVGPLQALPPSSATGWNLCYRTTFAQAAGPRMQPFISFKADVYLTHQTSRDPELFPWDGYKWPRANKKVYFVFVLMVAKILRWSREMLLRAVLQFPTCMPWHICTCTQHKHTHAHMYTHIKVN